MTTCSRFPRSLRALACIAALATFVTSAHAQVCRGAPSGSSAAYSYEQLSVGSSNGVTAALVGGHLAAAIDARYRTISSSHTGLEGVLHVSGVFGTSHLSICPRIRLGLVHDTWDVRSGLSVTSNEIVTGAGVGVGYEQPIVDELTVAPFVHVGYGFNALIFSMDATNATTNVTGDTLSGLIADYGVVLQYRRFYAAYSASRAPGQDGNNPRAARFIIGVAFSDRRLKK
jgi:hypothetical protein